MSRSKLRFYVTQSEGVTIQVMAQADQSPNPEKFVEEHEYLQRGDIIGIVGFPGRTNPQGEKNKDKPGELSIFATSITLLTPCLRQLPTEHFGLKDQETRYRQRFVDLIMNKSSRDTLITRSRIVQYVRRFLDARGFLEVQTPMMNKIAGGASKLIEERVHDDWDRKILFGAARELQGPK